VAIGKDIVRYVISLQERNAIDCGVQYIMYDDVGGR
jgi:hypothetical protein